MGKAIFYRTFDEKNNTKQGENSPTFFSNFVLDQDKENVEVLNINSNSASLNELNTRVEHSKKPSYIDEIE